jgi:hypothetical protein
MNRLIDPPAASNSWSSFQSKHGDRNAVVLLAEAADRLVEDYNIDALGNLLT